MKPVLRPLKVILVLLWSLLPLPVVWYGVHVLEDAVWTYALYHLGCLLPAIICGRHLWLKTVRRPSVTSVVALAIATVLFSAGALVLYEVLGSRLLSNDDVLSLLKRVGYSRELFWPLSFYAIAINPIFEELFWRGVIFNELERQKVPIKNFAIIWSSCTYALFHYTIFALVLFPIYAEIGTLLLAVYGGLMALIYRRTGSIVVAAMAHGLLTDVAIIVLIIDLLCRYPGTLL